MVLLFWIYFFLLTLVFVLQWLSLHWEVLIMLVSQFPVTSQQIAFQSDSQWDAPFYCIAYDYIQGFGMLVFFLNLSLMEFQVRYLALFLLFSVIDGFEWFWTESCHKNIQLMLEFLKAAFLVLHISYYTLMTFVMMLSVILLSMVMILLSILSVIRHLICGNKLNWLLNLNLIYKTLLTGEKSFFKMLGLTFSSKLDWSSYIISIAKNASKKIRALIHSMKFFSPEVAVSL